MDTHTKRAISHRVALTVILLLCIALAPPLVEAAGQRLKIGTLAPRGSLYHRALQEMGEEWREAQGGGAKFIVYTDGTQGGEADTVRRMRVGQLNAAMLSVVGLSEIDPSVSALQKIPRLYRNWAEVEYVIGGLREELEKRLHEKGFVAVFWAEAGWVQLFSREPVQRPEDLKSMKIFAWAGDPPQVQIMKEMGYQPIVLETADMLAGLQSGLIDVVLAPAVFALAGQFYAEASHMLRLNWVPIVGALVVTRRAWEAMRPQARAALLAAGETAVERVRAERLRLESDAIGAMQARGLTLHEIAPDSAVAWDALTAAVYPRVRGATVPADMFDRAVELVEQYRASRSAGR